MNIGIVTTWFERGAAYVSKQFKEILEIENNVFIYARGGEESGKGDPKWDLDIVHWAKKVYSPFYSGTVIDKADFLNWIANNGIEVVIFNEQHWFRPVWWCKEKGVKTIAYIDYYTEKTIPLFAIYDSLICNTKKHFSAFNWHKGACYIPWGTDVELYKPNNIDRLVNNDYVTFFHSAGYLGVRKGTDLLIKAIQKTKYVKKVVIHTQSDLYKLYPELAESIRFLISEGKLEIIHKTVPAPGLYHLGDVYVYPTRLEGIGLTIAESISSGLVPVVTNNGPMNEFVDSNFGFLITVDRFFSRYDGYYWPESEINVDDLVAIMDKLATEPNLVLSLKARARKYAQVNLDFGKNIQKLNEVVQKTEIRYDDLACKKIAQFENTGFVKFNDIIVKNNRLYKFFVFFMKKCR